MPLDIRADLERNLIDSITGGIPALEAFANSWSTLVDSLQAQPIDDSVSDLAYATARRVEVLASAFLEFTTEANAATSDFLTELETTLARLNVNDITPSLSANSPSERSSFQYPPNSSASPPYIAPAYKWLLKNIHNPYPSKETKELISRGTGTSLRNVDAWFINARRRIGWSSISKKYFSGSKIETVSAAFRALSDDSKPTANDEEQPPLPANIRMAFVEMESAAKELYSDKFTKSSLAGRLDGMVKDMTNSDKERRMEERKKEKALEKLKADRERVDKRSQDAQRRRKEAEEGYPSPSPEPESLTRRFETPSSAGSADEEDLRPPVPIAGHKRTSQELSDEREAVNDRPVKRSRMLLSSGSCSSLDSFSSVSRENSLEPFPLSPSSTACSTPPPSPSEDTSTSLPQQAPKRKRRLSDADAETMPKRPMPLVRPRLQVVSNPLPKSVPLAPLSTSLPSPVDEPTVLDWSRFFDQHFTAVTDELDTTGPIKMDMFDYSQFAEYASGGETSDGTDWEAQCEPFKCKGLLDLISQSSSPTIHVPSLTTFTNFDLPAPVSVLPDFELDFCATMGWPYVGSIPSKLASTGSALEDTELNKLDGLSSLASLPPYAPGLSSASEASCSYEGGFGIDWSSIIPHTIPPTQPVVSSLLTAATVATINPSVHLGSSAESRAEKLRKYQEHLAQARRLQEELAFV
uniref:Homeodomain 1 mating type protein n=1 Tax=Pleurotus eryngii TaxID=5323 RepID=A0A482JR95_PLEER|nr:homeodomain 1 mating type protein [Pleurotus eryngii]